MSKFQINQKNFGEFLSDREINSGAKLVVFALIRHLGGKRYCWPSQKNISEYIGISDRQVRTHLKMLEDNGYVTLRKTSEIQDREPYMGKLSNLYDLEYFVELRSY